MRIMIKQIRKAKSVTQKELCDKIGLRQASLSEYETGKTIPSLQNLIEIASFLNVTLDDLVEYERIHDAMSKEHRALMKGKNK